MVVSYKNKVLRTGWDCSNSDNRDRYACWAADFEREIELQCDKLGINPDDVGASIDDCGDLRKDPKETARKFVRRTAKRLRMI